MADKFFWYELMTSDADAALDFYGKVVGWTAGEAMTTPGGDRYTILSAGEHGIGGVMQLSEGMCEEGMRPIWAGYVRVADTDEAVRGIEAAGGSVRMPAQDIPGIGRFAMVADPGGALFYVMTPQPQGDAPPEAEPATPGMVSWRELYSSAGEKAAFAFYSGLFGWKTMHEMPMGPMGTYRIFGDGETQWGGMMDKPENVPASLWSFYVNVDGVDAAAERVTANGGQVIMGPMEVPDGSWVLQGVDPQGAIFALRSLKR